jgi:anthranilate phosphoribosyltransferase
MTPTDALEALVESRSLSRPEAAQLMQMLLRGEVSDVQTAGILVALRMKGVTRDELASFASELRAGGLIVKGGPSHLVDTCGTGGGSPSFNLSTGAAIVAAAAGAKVAKHGNRAVTSTCGSADVLEELGVRFTDDPTMATRHLYDVGLAFLFAPHFHPGMRHVGPVRKALGVRSVFNILGPLGNPAGARRQVIGVYDFAFARVMAEALALLGSERVWVVSGRDGLDEVSPVAVTRIASLENGEVREFELDPAELGLPAPSDIRLLPDDNIAANAVILRQALSGEDESRSWALVPNAAATLLLAGLVPDIRQGADLAWETIKTGKAIAKLHAWVETCASA